jgi:hypothetical protein
MSDVSITSSMIKLAAEMESENVLRLQSFGGFYCYFGVFVNILYPFARRLL